MPLAAPPGNPPRAPVAPAPGGAPNYGAMLGGTSGDLGLPAFSPGAYQQPLVNGGVAAQGLYSGLQDYLLGPAQKVLGAQIGQQQTQLGLTGFELGQQAQQAQQEAGYSLGQLGLQQNDLGLQRAALQAQAGPGGFQSQQAGLTSAEQAAALGQSQRALRGNATASGSINTAGTQQSWSDLLQNYGFQQQQAALTAKEQQQAYKTSLAQMGNAAKTLGISQQEIQSRLQNSLNQLGLQGYMDVSGTMQAIAQLQQGYLAGPQAQALQLILQGAGLPVQSFTGGS